MAAYRCLIASIAFSITAGVLVSGRAPSASGATWTKPKRVAGGPASALEIASARLGRTAVVWNTGAGLRLVARRSAHHAFTAPQPVGPPGSRNGRVGAGSDGEMILSWLTPTGLVQSSRLSPDLEMEPATTLGFPGASALSMATDSETGMALLGWRTQDNTIAVALLGPDNTPVLSGEIDPSNPLGPFGPVTALNQEHGLLAWSGQCSASDPTARSPAEAVMLGGVGSAPALGSVQSLPESDCPNAGLEGAVARDGGAAIVLNGRLARPTVRATTRPAGGAFGSAEGISGQRRGNFSQIISTGLERSLAVWNVLDRSSQCGLRLRRQGPAGFTQPSCAVRRPGGGLFSLSGDGNTRGLLVWQSLRTYAIRAAMWGNDAFRRPTSLRAELPHGRLARPVSSIASDRSAAVAFARPRSSGSYGVFVATTGRSDRWRRSNHGFVVALHGKHTGKESR